MLFISKWTKWKFSQWSGTVLWTMENCQEAKVRLTNTQLNRKNLQQKKTETILRIHKKNFEDGELLHGLFLATKQRTKLSRPLLIICQQA